MKTLIFLFLVTLNVAWVFSSQDIDPNYDPFHIHDGLHKPSIESKSYWGRVRRFFDQRIAKPFRGNFTDKHLSIIHKAIAADHYRHELEFQKEVKNYEKEVEKINKSLQTSALRVTELSDKIRNSEAALKEEKEKKQRMKLEMSQLKVQLRKADKTLRHLNDSMEISKKSHENLKAEKEEVLRFLEKEKKNSQDLENLLKSFTNVISEIHDLTLPK